MDGFGSTTLRDGVGGMAFEDQEVVEFPKINLPWLVRVTQSILALVGLVSLLERIRRY
jgi:hypothetical protein